MIQTTPVEWKPLGEVSKISSGGTPKTGISKYYDGDIPWLRTQEVNFNDIWNTEIKITKEGLQNSSAKLIPANCVIIAMYGATVGRVGINKIPLSTNQACANICVNKDILNYRFVFHYLCSQYEYIKSLGTGSQTNINAQIVKNIKIPIPPLEIQQKIVKILDKFTELEATLEATLEAELALRKRQYQYYRDFILDFDNQIGWGIADGYKDRLKDVVWKTLGEVFDLKNGYTPSKSNKEYWENGSIPWFRMEDIRENGRILDNSLQHISKSAVKGGKLFPSNSIIIATSATIGEHALITVPFLANQRFTSLSLKPEFADKLSIYFLYYYCFNLSEWCKKNTTTSSFASVDMNGFKRFPIPIPPLPEQEKITVILDKFDTLTHSISEGLPHEIALRRKQYEYYREQLLAFPKAT